MKYELKPEGDLFRLKALKDFGGVRAGERGGLVETAENLSQEGDCWISYYAKAIDQAWVFGNARISGQAIVADKCRVMDNARVGGHARVYGSAQVWGNALVTGESQVYGFAEVCAQSKILGHAQVYEFASLSMDCVVGGNSQVYGKAAVQHHAQLTQDCISTRSPVTLYLDPHTITLCDNNMVIGCTCLSRERWLALTAREIDALGYQSTEFNNQYGPLIRELLKL